MKKPYKEEVKNKFLDGLKKDLQGVTVLTSNKNNDNDEDLGGKPIGVHIGDDDSSSTLKVIYMWNFMKKRGMRRKKKEVKWMSDHFVAEEEKEEEKKDEDKEPGEIEKEKEEEMEDDKSKKEIKIAIDGKEEGEKEEEAEKEAASDEEKVEKEK
ncbi:synaptic vesicle membrane protein VAT-1 homolog [Capsicum annuum]|uniref:synaptic vesicle membrane protein VAT-1 homolog n=1 Tax=Capsicum annuum TaxID=4072 RepID=UPI001FB0FDB3|nr:synaptic vesicle membrane protein VAT-1 homolog [Capsicum annuum]